MIFRQEGNDTRRPEKPIGIPVYGETVTDHTKQHRHRYSCYDQNYLMMQAARFWISQGITMRFIL